MRLILNPDKTYKEDGTGGGRLNKIDGRSTKSNHKTTDLD